VNDVIVTGDAAYLTDSFRPYLYRLPLGPRGELPGAGDVEAIELTGDYQLFAGQFNADGIAATPDGQWLVIVHSFLGRLYRVDPATGYAEEIELTGGDVASGDGILLQGQTLYVVQNFLNQIGVVALDPGLESGMVLDAITNAAFRIPTTVDRVGSRLYAVNARFDVPPEDTGVEYEVVQVEP
jgi:hypothetical protein